MEFHSDYLFSVNAERARQILLGHAFALDDLNDPLMEGFLLSLRHFNGLKRDRCVQINDCLRVLTPQLQRDLIDREIIHALWSILWAARAWHFLPRGCFSATTSSLPKRSRGSTSGWQSWIKKS